MEWWGSWLGWLGNNWPAVVSALAAVVALIIAKRANRRAQESNKLAEASNRIAADALAKAAEANKISEDANKLSEDANAFAHRSVLQQEEDWFVDWRVQWDKENSVIILRNIGANTAHDLTVVVTSGPIHHVSRHVEDVACAEEVSFEIPEIAHYRVERDKEGFREAMYLAAYGSSAKDPRRRENATIVIRWKTGNGFPASKTIQKKLA